MRSLLSRSVLAREAGGEGVRSFTIAINEQRPSRVVQDVFAHSAFEQAQHVCCTAEEAFAHKLEYVPPGAR